MIKDDFTYYCSKCFEKTEPIYFTEDNRILCFECACKHYDNLKSQIDKEIKRLESACTKHRKMLMTLREASCVHTYEITGYGQMINGEFKNKYICMNCGKTEFI